MASFKEIKLKSGSSYEAKVVRKGHKPLSKTFRSLTLARQWAEEQEALIRRGSQPALIRERTTVGAAIDAYTEALGDELAKGKLYCLGMLKHHLGSRAISDITPGFLDEFLRKLKKQEIPPPSNRVVKHKLYDGDKKRTYSDSTVRKYFFGLRGALEWHAKRNGYPIGDAFISAKPPAAWKKPRERRLAEGEEELLLAATEGMLKSPEGWRLIIRLVLETGMRAQEINQMLWSELFLKPEERFIYLPAERVKTARSRQVPLSSEALRIIERLKELALEGEQRVFWMLPRETSGLGLGFRRICKRAGSENLTFHDLRREATSRIFERTDLRTVEVMLMTGHTDARTLKKYARPVAQIIADRLDPKPVKKTDQ